MLKFLGLSKSRGPFDKLRGLTGAAHLLAENAAATVCRQHRAANLGPLLSQPGYFYLIEIETLLLMVAKQARFSLNFGPFNCNLFTNLAKSFADLGVSFLDQTGLLNEALETPGSLLSFWRRPSSECFV